jgi:GMP reductase
MPGVELGGRKFRMPVVPANMKTVVDESICVWLAQNGYFYVMHRFDLDNVQFVAGHEGQGPVCLHLAGRQKARLRHGRPLVELGLVPEYITIDIAHGHADSVKNMIAYLKERCPTDLCDRWQRGHTRSRDRPGKLGCRRHQGGHGPGKVCITKLKTGFGTGGWQLSAAQVVRPRGHQAHHCRRRHPRSRRHCQEHPLWCHHGDDRLAVCRP